MKAVDIEATLVTFLKSKGYIALTVVPKDRPDIFISIERTGGRASDVVLDFPTVALQCWAPTRTKAAKLAYEIDELVDELASLPQITSAKRNSLHDFSLDDQPRYQLLVDLVARKAQRKDVENG